MFILIFSMVVGAAPGEWSTWTKRLADGYKKTYSAPTKVQYKYLKKGDSGCLSQHGSHFRFVDSMRECVVSFQWDGKALTYKKGKESKPFKEMIHVDDRIKVSFSKAGDKVRLFLHDMKVPRLEQKRVREFYDYDKKFVVKGAMKFAKKQETIKYMRSDGTTTDMMLAGHLAFKVDGKEAPIEVLVDSLEDDGINLMLKDKSSGKETYGAGRYVWIDLGKKLKEVKEGEEVAVDFNYLYNPPCSISTGYHCPLPRNSFPTALLVGEKYLLKKVKK